jgi:hypothetical protein
LSGQLERRSAFETAIAGPRRTATMNTQRRAATRLLPAGAAAILAVGMLAGGSPVLAAGQMPVGLGSAATFAVLAGAPAVTNSGSTVIGGDLGLHPASRVTGFPPGLVNGETHPGDAAAQQAKVDLVVAYDDAAGRTPAAVISDGVLGGLTLVAGVYNAGGVTLGLAGRLTLDGQGDPSAVWIFQATSDLVTAASSSVALINGGQACNVFWQVTGSATLGADSQFAGNILALSSITLHSRVALSGRALARNGSVSLMNDAIAYPTCTFAAPTYPPATPGAAAEFAVAAIPTTGTTLPPTDELAAAVQPGSVPTPFLLLGVILVIGIAAVVVVDRWLFRPLRSAPMLPDDGSS